MKLLAPVLCLVSGSLFAADLTVVEEIIAKCNGDIITRGDLERSRKELANAARQQGANGPTVQQAMADHEKDFKLEMKNDMLRQRVIRQEVGDKVNVKHEEIEKYYNEHKTEFVRDERIFLREILVSTENK